MKKLSVTGSYVCHSNNEFWQCYLFKWLGGTSRFPSKFWRHYSL